MIYSLINYMGSRITRVLSSSHRSHSHSRSHSRSPYPINLAQQKQLIKCFSTTLQVISLFSIGFLCPSASYSLNLHAYIIIGAISGIILNCLNTLFLLICANVLLFLYGLGLGQGSGFGQYFMYEIVVISIWYCLGTLQYNYWYQDTAVPSVIFLLYHLVIEVAEKCSLIVQQLKQQQSQTHELGIRILFIILATFCLTLVIISHNLIRNYKTGGLVTNANYKTILWDRLRGISLSIVQLVKSNNVKRWARVTEIIIMYSAIGILQIVEQEYSGDLQLWGYGAAMIGIVFGVHYCSIQFESKYCNQRVFFSILTMALIFITELRELFPGSGIGIIGMISVKMLQAFILLELMSNAVLGRCLRKQYLNLGLLPVIVMLRWVTGSGFERVGISWGVVVGFGVIGLIKMEVKSRVQYGRVPTDSINI